MPSIQTWGVMFFESTDGVDVLVQVTDFLDACPPKVAARIVAVLQAVAASPPPRFGGGGYWEAMHGNMNGFYEVRVGHGTFNYRLLCVLNNPFVDLDGEESGPDVVCLTGFRKPVRSAANDRDYRAARTARDEFSAHPPGGSLASFRHEVDVEFHRGCESNNSAQGRVDSLNREQSAHGLRSETGSPREFGLRHT
jgi:hypothetical protein